MFGPQISDKLTQNVDNNAHFRRIETVRFTSWFIMFVAVCWSLLGLAINEPSVIGIALIAALGSVIAIFTMDGRFNLLGRCVWMFCGQMAVLVGCFVVDEAANVPMMFGAIIGGPFLVFSLLSERIPLFFFSFSNIVYWIVVWVLGADYFGAPVIAHDIAETYIELPVAITTLMIILIELGFFAIIANSYAVQMYDSNRKAQEANVAKSTFLANMSHEIRTPMNGVLGLLDVLDGPDMNRDQKRIVRTMRESSVSLLRIIDDILDTSKIEAGQLELNPTRIRILPTIESIVESLTPFADSKRVELNFRMDPKMPAHILCDGGRLRQVVLNLMSNAIKFSSKEDPTELGLVRLYLAHDETDLLIRVHDNGVGMDEDELHNIFEPFIQAKAGASGRFGGTGLGLTIVQQLVQKMGGTIDVSSTVGQGTEFSVHIPLRQAGGANEAPNLQGRRVVAYVPEPGLAQYMEGYTTYTGAEFYRFEDEDDFCKALGEDANAGSLAVIALSGKSSFAMQEVARRVKALYPDQGVLTFTAHRGAISAKVQKGHQIIHWTPLLLSEYWTTLAEMFDVFYQSSDEAETSQSRDPGIVDKNPDKPLSILVVEDNEINQFVILEQLRKIGLTAEIANDGVEGFKQWETGRFNLILCDCHMPRMNGFAMTEKIRESEFSRSIARTPVIAITANALLGEADQCFSSGMDDYLSKPFAIKDLKAAIAKWVE